MPPPSPPITPREGAGLDVAEIVGVEEPETITDWLPAVMLLAHTTITVYVPG